MKTPRNFGEVIEGIFRGAWPNPENLRALREKGVRTIVTLYSPVEGEPARAEQLGRQVRRAGMFSLPLEITDKVSLLEAAARVLAAERATYVHCVAGANRTGQVALLVQIFFALGNGKKVGEPEVNALLAEAAQYGFDFDPPYQQILMSILQDLSRQGSISWKEETHVFPKHG